jgi:hypothetical protein
LERRKGRSYMRNGTDRASPRPGLDRPTAKSLEGEWRLERLGGALPPLSRARKEIRGERGKTRFGPFPGVPFKIKERGDRFALIYRRPFSMLIDEVRKGPDGSWLGEATLAGRTFGRFRMTRIPQTEGATGRGESR